MKGKIDFKILIIILLTLILIVMLYLYLKNDNNNINSHISNNLNNDTNNNSDEIIIFTTSEISSSLTENIQLHATYYLEESYMQLNQTVKSGENILKYTNGTYLTAPYDCVITQINLPNEGEKCTNSHSIQISSVNRLMVKIKVDESKIKSITLGQEASIEIEAYEGKILQGNVTNISSTASNGNFTVTVEFENDETIMLGMTAKVTIKNN